MPPTCIPSPCYLRYRFVVSCIVVSCIVCQQCRITRLQRCDEERSQDVRQNNSNNSNNLNASRLREMVATWKELEVLLAVIDRRFLRLGMLGDGHCPYVSQRLRQHPAIEYLQENLTIQEHFAHFQKNG